MDDAQLNQTSGPKSPRGGSWTSRIILWTLACAIGLWLGMGSRTAAAGGKAIGPSVAAKTAIADVFRFDILLAGKESPGTSSPRKAVSEKQFNLPAAVLIALEQRPEPVPSAMPKTLACTRPRFMLAPPVRPAGPWRVQLDANMARSEQTQHGLRSLLTTVPGLTVAQRRSIQAEVEKACEQIGSLRMEETIQAPQPPEPPADFPEAWAGRSTQLMP